MAQHMGDAAAAAERLKKDLEREAKAAQGETGAADAGELQAGQGSRDDGQKTKTKTGLEPG